MDIHNISLRCVDPNAREARSSRKVSSCPFSCGPSLVVSCLLLLRTLLPPLFFLLCPGTSKRKPYITACSISVRMAKNTPIDWVKDVCYLINSMGMIRATFALFIYIYIYVSFSIPFCFIRFFMIPFVLLIHPSVACSDLI